MSQDDIDDDDKYSDYIRFSSQSDNEIETNELYEKDESEPLSLNLFNGSLQAAFQAAFNSPQIEERRPILVHIVHNHDQTSLLSKLTIAYLNINYIVWSYDITYDTNRTIMNQIWKEIFSVDFCEMFDVDQCCLLIGITRLFQLKTKTENKYDYQFKILNKNPTPEALFDQLVRFKNDFDKNELGLSFDISEKTGLPWEIIVEIAQYLSFKDAVSTFPINIFYLLSRNQSIVQLINPWDPIIETVLSKINSNQIRSIEWNGDQKYDNDSLKFVSKFKNTNSITFRNLRKTALETYHSEQYFSSLMRICLYFDNQIDYYFIILMFYDFQKIRYLEINCPGLFYSKRADSELKKVPVQTRIEYFLLDLRRIESVPSNYYIPMAGLMRYMRNIQYIRIKIKSHDFQILLSDEQWKEGIRQCLHLKKIIIEAYNHTPEMKKYLLWKTQDMKKLLHPIRDKIQFRIVLL